MSLNQYNEGSESLESCSFANISNADSANSEETPCSDSQSGGSGLAKSAEKRRVTFPDDDKNLITGYLEPVNPWQSVTEISGSELIEEYVASCAKHNTNPQQIVLDQLKACAYLGPSRSGVLSLSSHPLKAAQCEALEAVLRRARFNRIEVCNASLTDETAVALFDMLEYYESASELDISYNTEFGILGWQACSKMVNKSQYLEQLEARGTSLSENTAPVLGRGLKSPCALRVLHLQRAGLRGRTMLCLTSALKLNKSVRELHIGDNNLCPEDAGYLASLLGCNTFLQLLDISNNDIQDLGVEHIAEALSKQSTPSPSPSTSTSTSTSSSSTGDSTTTSPQSLNSSACQERGLVVLVMWNNNLTRNSGMHLSKALTRCKSLEVLNIGQNPLGGETINRVRAALQQNRSLLCLGIQGARLGAEAGVTLAEVIEDNNCIQRIDLRDNKLQMAGLLALVTALRKNFALTRLDVDDALPSHNSGVDQPLEEAKLIEEIRSLCKRNEMQLAQQHSSPSTPTSEENLHRRRVASFTTRKISLTCQTLHRNNDQASEPVLSPPKIPSGRLRSPLPSPVPSPASSPIPSPSHRSRFTVSRVSDSSSVTSESSSPSTPPSARSFFPNSRFKVVSVQEPPKINVTMAPEEGNADAPDETTTDLNENICANSCEDSSDTTTTGLTLISESPVLHEEITHLEETTSTTHAVAAETVDTRVGHPPRDVAPAAENVDSFPESTVKSNKGELNLDSPDLEVSRLMLNKDHYGSSSSLDLSGSSLESLNHVDTQIANNNTISEDRCEETSAEGDHNVFHAPEESEDVFPVNDYKNPFICSVASDGCHNRKKLSASSNESSLESSTFEAGVMVAFPHHGGHQSNLLNCSVSSNESVSPNIFGKHMKLHGSVTSLEASVSSLDSCRSRTDFVSPQNPGTFTFPTPDKSVLVESVDSGICQSDSKRRTPSFNESFSSNEGTLTSSSNIKSSISSMGGDSSLSIEDDNDKSIPRDTDTKPRRVTSLLDVPSMQKSPRTRKISWVAPSNFNQSQQPNQGEQGQQSDAVPSKAPSNLEKLLSLFQHPGSIFSRSDTVDKKGEEASQSSSRRDSQTSVGSGSFWPWNLSNPSSSAKVDSKSATLGAIQRLKKYGESFETALQFSSDHDRKLDLHPSKSETYLENKECDTSLTSDMADTTRLPPQSPSPPTCSEDRETPALSATLPTTGTNSTWKSSGESEGAAVPVRHGTPEEGPPGSGCSEMGSVFKFPNVYEQSPYPEEGNNNCSYKSTNACGGGEDAGRTLTESERQNISEIVRSVCEEAVRSVAAHSRCRCRCQCRQVQTDGGADCDSNYTNKGCLCDWGVCGVCCVGRSDLTPAAALPSETSDSDSICDNRQQQSHSLFIYDKRKLPRESPQTDSDLKKELTRPTELSVRAVAPKQIAMVLKQSVGLDNIASGGDRQLSPESGPSVENLPSKIVRRFKENVSPENTLTSSMSNTRALAQELMERKKELGGNTALWEIGLKENVAKILEGNNCNAEEINPRVYAELLVEPFDQINKIANLKATGTPPKEQLAGEEHSGGGKGDDSSSLGEVDQGSDALTLRELTSDHAPPSGGVAPCALEDDGSLCDSSLLDTESVPHLDQHTSDKDKGEEGEGALPQHSQTLLPDTEHTESIAINVASDELNQQIEMSEFRDCFQDFTTLDTTFQPVSILKKATPSISKTVSLPQNIPEATKPLLYYGHTLPTPKKLYDASMSKSCSNVPIRCGSLPENSSEVLDTLALQSRHAPHLKSPVQNKLGKMARDSLFALNMSEEELKEYRASARLSSMDSVRSLGSLSQDFDGLSSSSYVFQSSSDRESILEQGASQDSLVSLDSISENVSESGPVEEGHQTYDSV